MEEPNKYHIFTPEEAEQIFAAYGFRDAHTLDEFKGINEAGKALDAANGPLHLTQVWHTEVSRFKNHMTESHFYFLKEYYYEKLKQHD